METLRMSVEERKRLVMFGRVERRELSLGKLGGVTVLPQKWWRGGCVSSTKASPTNMPLAWSTL